MKIAVQLKKLEIKGAVWLPYAINCDNYVKFTLTVKDTSLPTILAAVEQKHPTLLFARISEVNEAYELGEEFSPRMTRKKTNDRGDIVVFRNSNNELEAWNERDYAERGERFEIDPVAFAGALLRHIPYFSSFMLDDDKYVFFDVHDGVFKVGEPRRTASFDDIVQFCKDNQDKIEKHIASNHWEFTNLINIYNYLIGKPYSLPTFDISKQMSGAKDFYVGRVLNWTVSQALNNYLHYGLSDYLFFNLSYDEFKAALGASEYSAKCFISNAGEKFYLHEIDEIGKRHGGLWKMGEYREITDREAFMKAANAMFKPEFYDLAKAAFDKGKVEE